MFKYSIIMPAYNAEMFVRDMIESIKSQSYTNWELIIIDDGSTDNTGKICDEYANEQICVIHNENKGQICARVDGILKASGDYTLVVDADDRLQSDCLESINSVLENHEYDCVAFPYSLFDSSMNFMDVTISPETTGKISQKDFLIWIIDTLNHPLYNKMVRTATIQAGANEAIRDKVSINGDYALVIPIISNTIDIYYLNKSLYDYRVLDNSISHNRSFRQIIDTDLVSNAITESLKSHNLLDKELENLIFKKYLCMLKWLMCEIVDKRYVTNEELKMLHKCTFYLLSKEYETLDNFDIKQLLILRAIRGEGILSGFRANVFIKICNIISRIKNKFS